MKVSEVLEILSREIITDVKWKNDPCGLLVGNPVYEVSKILTALNPTLEVVQEAKDKGCGLIVSHHPLFKNKTDSLVEGDYYSDVIRTLVKYDISLISFHTCYDLLNNGVSSLIASEIGIKNIKPLVPVSQLKDVEVHELYKLVVYTPQGFENKIKRVIDRHGGASIGNYGHCFFSNQGTGSFRPSDKANPYIGKSGKIENVKETRIETVIPEWKINDVINSLKKSHPYEVPVIDLYRIYSDSGNFGLGAIGDLEQKVNLKDLCSLVSNKLNTQSLRIVPKREYCNNKLSRIAVCGGSGASFWKYALSEKADVFISSEFGHHIYQEASYHINIIDATHHSTEQFVKKGLKVVLERFFDGTVFESKKDIDKIMSANEIYKPEK